MRQGFQRIPFTTDQYIRRVAAKRRSANDGAGGDLRRKVFVAVNGKVNRACLKLSLQCGRECANSAKIVHGYVGALIARRVDYAGRVCSVSEMVYKDVLI